MKKDEATECLLEAKAEKGLTFADIEEAIGADKVWLAAAIMGQASVPEELAEKMVEHPDWLSYLHLQDKDYRALKQRCAAHAQSGELRCSSKHEKTFRRR